MYSRLMCWVAIDRGLRLADKRSFPADRDKWLKVRDEIYEEIMEKGWSQEREAFVQSYGDDTLDASNLIMPLVFFLSPSDPRMLKTLDAINRPPKDGGLVSNSLVYRYDVQKSADGLTGEEGTFSLCTFWLVEALTRAGRLEESRLIFEQMLGYANHLGLYAEEIGHHGEALGNFPQAFTHLTLISAAYNLDRALGSSGIAPLERRSHSMAAEHYDAVVIGAGPGRGPARQSAGRGGTQDGTDRTRARRRHVHQRGLHPHQDDGRQREDGLRGPAFGRLRRPQRPGLRRHARGAAPQAGDRGQLQEQ